jgi:hypothetical protein
MSDGVRVELDKIRAQRQQLTAEDVVKAATPKSHPLHHRFEWDNRVAGHAYRVHQAAELIRSVRIEVVIDDAPEHVRAYVSVPRPTGRAYEAVREVAEDPVASEIVRREYERAWLTLRRRYQNLAGFIQFVRADLAAARDEAG